MFDITIWFFCILQKDFRIVLDPHNVTRLNYDHPVFIRLESTRESVVPLRKSTVRVIFITIIMILFRCNSCPGVGREKDTMTHAIESIFSRGEGGTSEESVSSISLSIVRYNSLGQAYLRTPVERILEVEKSQEILSIDSVTACNDGDIFRHPKTKSWENVESNAMLAMTVKIFLEQ